MRRQIWSALRMLAVMTVVAGVLYPFAVTGVAQTIFPNQANGSMTTFRGESVGSRLLGQSFVGDEYFHPRPSAVSYDAKASAGSNLGPTNPRLLEQNEARARSYRERNGLSPDVLVPVDAVTASASGLDPHISPANARLQAPRVAQARGMSLNTVIRLIDEATVRSGGGLLAEASVHVLELNIALEEAN